MVSFHRVYSIEKENGLAVSKHFESEDSLDEYIQQIIDENDNHHDRRYKFCNEDTYFPDVIEKIFQAEDNIDDICQEIADRLLEKETEANNKIAITRKTIPSSFLIIAMVVNNDTETKLLFIKADKTSFINTRSGNLDIGLPAQKKRKIFKSCVFDIIIENGTINFNNIISHDANSQGKAVYWYHDFLCLNEVKSDESNTKDLYDRVKSKILNPIKKNHPHDYINCRNAVVHYFRSEGDFDSEYFRDNVIGSYQPFDESLDMESLKDKVDKLFEDGKIDKKFQKKPNEITDKFKDKVKLSDDIELTLLQDIQNVSDVIIPGDDNGRKFIKIYSDEGYKYAKGLKGREQ